MKGVLQECPDEVAEQEANPRLQERGQRKSWEVCQGEAGFAPEGRKGSSELEHGAEEEIRGDGAPEDRYDIPRGPGEDLQNTGPK